jgi:guanylate kinase
VRRSIGFKHYFVQCTIFLALDGLAWGKAMAAMVTSPTGPADRTRRGLLIVLSSPSGAGKSTISRRLMEEDPSITMSISATTRPMRPGETADVDYHFVDDEKFQQLVEADELAEWAYVFGYRYGSPKEPIKEALRSGRDTLFDIDWQGTQQLEYAFRTDLVRIFILPPSMAELRRRLVDRGTDGDEVIDFRMLRAAAEIGHWAEYDYVLINEDVDRCTEAVQAIVAAERLRRERQPYLLDFVRELVEKPN